MVADDALDCTRTAHAQPSNSFLGRSSNKIYFFQDGSFSQSTNLFWGLPVNQLVTWNSHPHGRLGLWITTTLLDFQNKPDKTNRTRRPPLLTFWVYRLSESFILICFSGCKNDRKRQLKQMNRAVQVGKKTPPSSQPQTQTQASTTSWGLERSDKLRQSLFNSAYLMSHLVQKAPPCLWDNKNPSEWKKTCTFCDQHSWMWCDLGRCIVQGFQTVRPRPYPGTSLGVWITSSGFLWFLLVTAKLKQTENMLLGIDLDRTGLQIWGLRVFLTPKRFVDVSVFHKAVLSRWLVWNPTIRLWLLQGPVHTGCGGARKCCMQKMEHIVANWSVHTALQAVASNIKRFASKFACKSACVSCVNWAQCLLADCCWYSSTEKGFCEEWTISCRRSLVFHWVCFGGTYLRLWLIFSLNTALPRLFRPKGANQSKD